MDTHKRVLFTTVVLVLYISSTINIACNAASLQKPISTWSLTGEEEKQLGTLDGEQTKNLAKICGEAKSCENCTKLSGCGWCANVRQSDGGICTPGNSTGPLDEHACTLSSNDIKNEVSWQYGECGHGGKEEKERVWMYWIIGVSCAAGVASFLGCIMVLVVCYGCRRRRQRYHHSHYNQLSREGYVGIPNVADNDVEFAAGQAAACGIWICIDTFWSLLCSFLKK